MPTSAAHTTCIEPGIPTPPLWPPPPAPQRHLHTSLPAGQRAQLREAWVGYQRRTQAARRERAGAAAAVQTSAALHACAWQKEAGSSAEKAQVGPLLALAKNCWLKTWAAECLQAHAHAASLPPMPCARWHLHRRALPQSIRPTGPHPTSPGLSLCSTTWMRAPARAAWLCRRRSRWGRCWTFRRHCCRWEGGLSIQLYS